MLVSAADILPREERNKSSFFFPFSFFLTRENARGVPLSLARQPRASPASFLVLLHTHTSGWLRKWSSITERNSRRGTQTSSGWTWSVSCSRFSLLSFFFLNSTSDVYLHAFKLHRRIRGSRGPKYRSDSLIQAASNPPRIHATLHLFTYVSEQTNPPQMRSLYLLLKKYFFFSSFGAAGRLTSRGLRHGIRGCM